MLKSHVTELKRTVEEVADFPAYYIFERNLFFWADMRTAAFSLFSGVWWQVVVTYPQYLPASFPGIILVIMTMNYVNRQRAKHQIQTKPSFLRLCSLMLSLPFARPSPLVTPRAPRLASSMSVDPKLDDPLRRKTHEEEEEWWIKYEKKLSKKALNKQKTGALAGVPMSSEERRPRSEVVADAPVSLLRMRRIATTTTTTTAQASPVSGRDRRGGAGALRRAHRDQGDEP